MRTLTAIIIISWLSSSAFAQAGLLDTTFGIGGCSHADICIYDDYANAIAIQSDGKIILAGQESLAYGGSHFAWVLMRYNSNGKLDSSFGTAGIVTTKFAYGNEATSIVLQPDGKIIAAGVVTDSGIFNDRTALARYKADGTLDSSFGIDGKVIIDPIYKFGGCYSIALQGDGKILACAAYDSLKVVRLTSEGIIDNTFGNNGFALLPPSTSGRVLAQGDGKAVVFGNLFNGMDDDAMVARFLQEGGKDNSFGMNGIAYAGFQNSNEILTSAVVQMDGKIVGAGLMQTGLNTKSLLVRFNSDGSLDSLFGNNGFVITSGVFDPIDWAVMIQQDGKIVTVGSDNIYFSLGRYNPDGSPDALFGANGIVDDQVVPNSNDRAFAGALQTDGKIVAAGFIYVDNISSEFGVARFLSGLNVGILNFSSAKIAPLIYPNPIQQIEQLQYTLVQNESLTISLYDMNGKWIKNFITNEKQNAGEHREQLTFDNMASGNYLLRIATEGGRETIKLNKQ